MKNLVSIIMPYFKKKEFFLQSIKSVLDQTHSNIEVLIVYDDYNKEDLSYIENCINKDSRVKIFINDKLFEQYRFQNIIINPIFQEHEFNKEFEEYNF